MLETTHLAYFQARTHEQYVDHVKHVCVRHKHLYDSCLTHLRFSRALLDFIQPNNCGEVVLALLKKESKDVVDILESCFAEIDVQRALFDISRILH